MRERFRLESDRIPRECHTLLPWGVGCDESGKSRSSVWRRIIVLVEHDERDRARQLYQSNGDSILKTVPEPERELFKRYATHLVEDYHRAWNDASGSIRAFSSIYPERSSSRQQMAYPQAFAPLVEYLGGKYQIPKYFVYGIMLQE